VIKLINDGRNPYVRRIHQYMRYVNGAKSSFCVPIPVSHISPIHFSNSRTCIYHIIGCNITVFHCNHDTGCLKCRSWLHHTTNGIVFYFLIFPTFSLCHIDNRFHIAGFYLHQDHYTRRSIYFLQFVNQRFFTNILHVYVNCCYYITPVFWRNINNIHKPIHHFLPMSFTISTSQNGIERKFDTIFCTFRRIGIKASQCSRGKRAKRFLSSVVYYLI